MLKTRKKQTDVRGFSQSHTKLRVEKGLDEETVAKVAEYTSKRSILKSVKPGNTSW